MRRALLLGAAVIVVAAGTVMALVMSHAPPAATGEPRITRVFIPDIKETCIGRAGLTGEDLGFGFTDEGALHTLDPGDGSVTGLPVQQLAELNVCLARYPIEPNSEAPRDPYGRNLLYDYFSGVQKACLESRVEGVPGLPTRADFVVRLYQWDPFRVLAPELDLDQLLQLSAECPERPEYMVG